ncbi:MAG: LCP family protein [Clostridium sp.]
MIFILVGTYTLINLSKIKTNKILKDNESLGISNYGNAQSSLNKNIINIALFGLDARSEGETSRSDATMVLTIDKKSKKIKLTSLMRDIYVPIDNHSKDKLNHAYAFGGPQLAIKTINKNFDLNIEDYFSIDFNKMEKAIDALGGVDLDIKEYELKEVNRVIIEFAGERGIKASTISSPGIHHLNGMQALAYTRIRAVGNGDFERTERQRTIMTALFKKARNTGISEIPKIITSLLPLVETSMSKTEIILLAKDILTAGLINLETMRFPLDNFCEGAIIDGTWYLTFDSSNTKKQLKEYIFNDIKPIIN